MGSDSVEATQKVVDAFGAGAAALSGARFVPLYADDVVYNDFVFGHAREGKAASSRSCGGASARPTGHASLPATPIAAGACSSTGGTSTRYEAWIQPITVLEIRDGKIVTESWYYQDPFKPPAGKPLEPKPLTSVPGPADTAAAAEAVALKYAAALQAKDAAAVAALSAPKIAFMDTAASAVGSSRGQVQAHYARIFKKPADLAFTDLRYAFGPGWATLIWVADSPSVGGGGRDRRDHARGPRRQDRPRDALLHEHQLADRALTRGAEREGEVMRRPRRCRWCACVTLALLVFAGVVALAACGGSSTAASTSPSAAATPQVAATPERLVDSDSVAVTQKAVDAYAAAWDARSVAQLGRVYARDVVFDCHATGVHVDGREAFLELMGGVFGMTTGTHALAGHAGRGWGVFESRQDVAEGSMQILQLIETRGGKIVRLANYYQPVESQLSPLRAANPLRSAPGPADTPVAAEAVALKYAAALQAKDADAIVALGAPSNEFRDTAGFNAPPASELNQYADIFRKPADLAFTNLRYAFGRGWAAVIWTAFSAGSGGDGVTMLEIRNGKICRETLYYNSDKTPF